MNEQPLWTPSDAQIAAAAVTEFMAVASRHSGRTLNDHDALWQWSIADIEAFWSLVWDQLGVIGDKGTRVLVDGHRMPGARWFPDATLSYAENLLQYRGDGDAVVFWGEDKVKRRLSREALYT